MTSDLIALPENRTTHPLLDRLAWVSVGARTPGLGSAGLGSVQTFDAADEFLVHEFARRRPANGSEVVIVNDRFGALAAALSLDHEVTSCGDSSVAFIDAEENLAANGRTCTFVPSTASFDDRLDPFTFAIMRVSKSLALLEHQLLQIRSALAPGSPVLCGGMEKHLSKGVNALLDRLIGPSTASLGWRKSRLIMAACTPGIVDRAAVNPFPTCFAVDEPNTPTIKLVNHANVFSRNGLDQGTRALLPYLAEDLGQPPDRDRPLRVTDLGCGNGVIGIISALNNPEAQYHFYDESFMAVESARASWHEAFEDRPATFAVGNGLEGTPARFFDVVLCNPPFHQDHHVGDETAWRMFLGAHRALAHDGSLLIVGNRHLNHHTKLHRLFGGVEIVGGNSKFVVLHARRN